ncbi:Retinoblastoma-like protein 1 [Orchesella cincta]|uniref:Retinoblastoma-like protein 1 n=1 Tax=Orchesella cincta TaxID=48709 RepID=A0A1D2N0V2_ORCCI|nr:Retinoblastoma-like protein 1 [Orchesella cincta]
MADMAGIVDFRLIGSDPACIINMLCDLYDGISVEAKTIKEYWLKPKIRSMIEQGLLRGDPDTLTGLIDEDAFESNSKRLEKEYEEYVLTEGDFDERMYLSVERQADFGMDTQDDFLKTFDKQALFKTCPPLNELRHIMPATPLTGKKYLGEKDDPLSSPVSSATQTVSRLQALLSGRKAEASQTLRDIVANFPKNPIPIMEERLKNLSELFCVRFACTKGEKQPGMHTEFAYYRSQLAQTLFYRLLESILAAENKQRSDKSELSVRI